MSSVAIIPSIVLVVAGILAGLFLCYQVCWVENSSIAFVGVVIITLINEL
jgi:predicted acyltransferase